MIRHLLLAVFIVYFASLFVPRFSADAKVGGRPPTHCPDGYAYQLPATYPTGGQYIACESFDEFHTLLAKGHVTEAEKMIFGPAAP